MNDTDNMFSALTAIMARLRDPDNGCPWDIKQDFASIAPYTIEEAYEVADAIQRGDMDDLKEELGDLILQPVYHAQMAAEKGLFTINDVLKTVADKMIARHPHVFGAEMAEKPEDVDKIWEMKKEEERRKKAGSDVAKSALDGVPLPLPALTRAVKLQKKAAKTGFEWTCVQDVFVKLDEEIKELSQAIENNVKNEIEDELGDVLFVLANISRLLDIEPEAALRRANDKFCRRFNGMENDFIKEGTVISDTDLTQMNQMWRRQKDKERAAG